MLLTNAPMFGEKHLIGLGIIAVIILILLVGTKRLEEKDQKKHILFLMILFFALEIAKLWYIIAHSGSFPMNHLPLHLCSLPLYLYPIMFFAKKDSIIQKFVQPAAFSVVMLAGLIALAMPSTIIGSELSWLPLSNNVLPIISFTFHGLMIYASLSLIKTGFYEFDIKDYPKALVTVLPLLIAALLANHYMDKDYMSLNRGAGVPFNGLIETSHFLYMVVLIGVAFLVIFIMFNVTHWIINPNTNQNQNSNYSD